MSKIDLHVNRNLFHNGHSVVQRIRPKMAEIGITPPSAPSLPVGIAWPKTRITPASGLGPAASLGLPGPGTY